MKKRIFKTLGIVLAGVIGLVGILVGVMALTGRFKADPIYPARLFFESDSLTVNYDANNPNELHSFTLTAESDKAKPVNQRTVYIYLIRQNQVNGENLINITDKDGNNLAAESDGFYKVNCNSPIYFKVNRAAVETSYISNEYGYVEIFGQARKGGSATASTSTNLRINVDIKAQTLQLTDGLSVMVNSGALYNLEFEVGPNNALSSITNTIKKFELYYKNPDSTYTYIDQSNCSDYDLEWVGNPGLQGSDAVSRNIYMSGYRFTSKEESISHTFAAVLYPTNDYTVEDSVVKDMYTVYNNHIRNIPNCEFTINVRAKDVDSVGLLKSNLNLNLNLNNQIDVNTLVTMTGTGASDRIKEIGFGIADDTRNFAVRNVEFTQTASAPQSVIVESNNLVPSGGAYIYRANDATYTLNIDSRLTLKSKNGQYTYRLVDKLTRANETYKANVATFVREQNGECRLVVLGTGSYMDFYTYTSSGSGFEYTTALNTEFDYDVVKSIDNMSFTITPHTEIASTNTLCLNIFVVNSNGAVIMPQTSNGTDPCKISTSVVTGNPTRKSENLQLEVSYNGVGRTFNSTQLGSLFDMGNLTNTNEYSYTTFALVTPTTSIGLDVANDKVFAFNGTNYNLVGYEENGDFVNAVHSNEQLIGNSNMPTIYLALFKTNGGLSDLMNANVGIQRVYTELSISTSIHLNVSENDFEFTFAAQNDQNNEYLTIDEENGLVKYVSRDGKENSLTISSGNELLMKDIETLYGNRENNLVSLLNMNNGVIDNNDSTWEVSFTESDTTNLVVRFADNLVTPSENDYYFFVLNLGEQQIRCSKHVYFVPNSPHNIQLKFGNINDAKPVSLANSQEDVENGYPYIKATIDWRNNNYSYSYSLVYNGSDKEIDNINTFFNATASNGVNDGFFATPYPNLERSLNYTVVRGANYISLTEGTIDVLRVTGEDYAVISITCESEVRYIKVIVVALETESAKFEAQQDKDKTTVENSTINLVDDGQFSYTYNGNKIPLDGAIFSNLTVDYAGFADYDINCEDVTLSSSTSAVALAKESGEIAKITVGENIILSIEYKQITTKDNNTYYDLVLTRKYNLNTSLYISFFIQVKTIADPVKVEIRFNPPLQINENSAWKSEVGYYQGTTVLLYKVYTNANEMLEDEDQPIFKLLNKNGAGEIIAKYTYAATSETETKIEQENNEYTFTFDKVGAYTFKFYTTSNGTETPITEHGYTLTVKENVVAVLKDSYKTNTINLKSDTENNTLSTYVDLYSYKTKNEDNTIYGKDNAMYNTFSYLKNKSAANGDASKLTSSAISDNGQDILTSTSGNITVGWIKELNYNKTFKTTLQYNNQSVVVWGFDVSGDRQIIDAINVNITNKYSANYAASLVDKTIYAYKDYLYADLFSLSNGTSQTITKLQMVSASGESGNGDITFNGEGGKITININDDNMLPSYTIDVVCTFTLSVTGEEKELIGTFAFTIKPYIPTQNNNNLTYTKDDSVDILKDAYNIEVGGTVENSNIKSIHVTGISTTGATSQIVGVGYKTSGEEGTQNWAADTTANFNLASYISVMDSDEIDAQITITITYVYNKTYSYSIPITITNTAIIAVHYPMDVSSTTDTSKESQDLTLYNSNGSLQSERFNFDEYEIVTLQQRTQNDVLTTSTTIDLANDELLNFSRVTITTKEGLSALPQNAQIGLYAYNVMGNGNYVSGGITIDGTKITFNVPNTNISEIMYFVFRIHYEGVQDKFYKIKTQFISEDSTIAGTYFENEQKVYATSDGGQIISNDSSDIKLLNTSIQNNIRALFKQDASFNKENLKFYFVNASYLGGGSTEGIVKVDGDNIILGGLLNGESAATLGKPADHLTIKILVAYYSSEEEIYAPIGVLTVYVTPTQSEVDKINTSLLKKVDDAGTTGEYSALLNSITENNLFGEDKQITSTIENIKITKPSTGFDASNDKITYNGANVVSLTGNTIKVENFTTADLEFIVTYKLTIQNQPTAAAAETQPSLTMIVHYTLNGLELTKRSGSETVGNKFEDDSFNNYLSLTSYIPNAYNGTVHFVIGDKISESLSYQGDDATEITALPDTTEANITANGSQVKYGYKSGKLVIYFTQGANEYKVQNIQVVLDGLAVKQDSEKTITITVTVAAQFNFTITNAKGDTSNNAYTITNLMQDGAEMKKYEQNVGSSLRVEKSAIAENGELVQYKIYDRDGSGTQLLTITTAQNATLTITFKDSSLQTSQAVKKIVLSDGTGDGIGSGTMAIDSSSFSESDSVNINFAHLAQAFNMVMEFTVKSGDNNYTGAYNYYLSVPSTYNGLAAVYETIGGTHEIVEPNDNVDTKYNLSNNLFASITSTTNIKGEQITNPYRLSVVDKTGAQTFDYTPNGIGFTDSNSINYISITNGDNQGLISINGADVTFNSVSGAITSSIRLSNSAGVSNLEYKFNIMPKGNGLDADSNKIYDGETNTHYTTLLVDDRGMENLKIGTIRDVNNTTLNLANLSIKENTGNNLADVTFTAVDALSGTTQNGGLSYKFSKGEHNEIMLSITGSSINSLRISKITVSFYGNGCIENGFVIYVINAQASSDAQSSEFYGYDDEQIDLSKIYSYKFNVDGTESKIEGLTYSVVQNSSYATIESGNDSGDSIDLNHVFSNSLENTTSLTLKTQVQNIQVHLLIQVKYNMDALRIIDEKNFDFTIKRDVGLYVNGENNAFDNRDYNFELDLSTIFDPTTNRPVWNLSNGGTTIVAKRKSNSRTIALDEVLSDIYCKNDDIDIEYSNGKLTFNKDINNPDSVYEFVFVLGGSDGHDYEQKLNIKFKGLIQIKPRSAGDNVFDNNGRYFNSGDAITPVADDTHGRSDSKALTISLANLHIGSGSEGSALESINYKTKVIQLSEWNSNPNAAAWAWMQDASAAQTLTLNNSIDLPTTAYQRAAVIYELTITYKSTYFNTSESSSTQKSTKPYYAVYLITGVNYVQGYSKDYEEETSNTYRLDVDGNLQTEASSKTILPLIKYEKVYTSGGDTATFKIVKDGSSSTVDLQMDYKGKTYRYTKVSGEQAKWVNSSTGGTNEEYYVEFKTDTVDIIAVVGNTKTTLTEQNSSSSSVKPVFSLLTSVTIFEYKTFVDALIQGGKFAFEYAQGAVNMPENYQIHLYGSDTDGYYLGVNLVDGINDDGHLFNSMLTANLKLMLNEENLNPESETFTLYTNTGIKPKATNLHNTNEIFGLQEDNPLTILGLGTAEDIKSNATNWVNGANSLELKNNDTSTTRTFKVNNTNYTAAQITFSGSGSTATKLYSNNLTTYVIVLESGTSLDIAREHFTRQIPRSTTEETDTFIEFDCSEIFTRWSMNTNGELTNNSTGSTSYQATYNDNQPISTSDVDTSTNGKIKVKAGALQTYLNDNKVNSVSLTFTVNSSVITITYQGKANHEDVPFTTKITEASEGGYIEVNCAEKLPSSTSYNFTEMDTNAIKSTAATNAITFNGGTIKILASAISAQFDSSNSIDLVFKTTINNVNYYVTITITNNAN